MMLIGGFVAWQATNYHLGSASRMGPGYYPLILGLFLILLGGAIILASGSKSLNDVNSGRHKSHEVLAENRRATYSFICIPLSILLFAVLLEPVGLIPACLALVIVSSLVAPVFSLRRLVGLCLGVPLLVVLIFVVGLGLPFTLVEGL